MPEEGDRRRRNEMLLEPVTIELSGSDRVCIANFIEKIPTAARTKEEQELLEKVR